LTLGGSPSNDAALGDRLGPAIAKKDVADTIGNMLEFYLDIREGDERFLDTYRRVGIEPFKKRVYQTSPGQGKER